MSSISVHFPTVTLASLLRSSWTDINQPTALRPDPRAGELFARSTFEGVASPGSLPVQLDPRTFLTPDEAARREHDRNPKLLLQRNAGEETVVTSVRDVAGNVVGVRREQLRIAG